MGESPIQLLLIPERSGAFRWLFLYNDAIVKNSPSPFPFPPRRIYCGG